MKLSVDRDRVVEDEIHLESLLGASERLLQQCHDIGAPSVTSVRLSAESISLTLRGPLRNLLDLRMYSALSVNLGDYEENVAQRFAPAVRRLRSSLDTGVLSALELGDTPWAFRVDPIPDRFELRDRIEEELGWVNDPSGWHVNLTRSGRLLLAQIGAFYWSSRFPAMERIPASTTPVLAALLVQLLKVGDGQVVYDPFCGSGTLLMETAATGRKDLTLLGSDLSRQGLAAAVQNRQLFPSAQIMRADAVRLPVSDASVDRIVSNLPFGKRVGSHAVNVELYPGFLAEVTRVLRPDGRAVLMTDDKNLFRQSVEATRQIRVLREVKMESGGLHPSAFVLDRTRAARSQAKPGGRENATPGRPRSSGPAARGR